MLNSLGANIVGIVVNGVDRKLGYGYKKYGSGGYDYRYGYGDGDKSGAYYQEDSEQHEPPLRSRAIASQPLPPFHDRPR